YKIDLRAWGLNWLDNPDAGEIRKSFRWDPLRIDRQLKVLADGRYRSVEEFRDVTSEAPYLATAPDSPREKAPRNFRRPVKVDRSNALAVRRSEALAAAEG